MMESESTDDLPPAAIFPGIPGILFFDEENTKDI